MALEPAKDCLARREERNRGCGRKDAESRRCEGRIVDCTGGARYCARVGYAPIGRGRFLVRLSGDARRTADRAGFGGHWRSHGGCELAPPPFVRTAGGSGKLPDAALPFSLCNSKNRA